jgi:hypothetical protein
VPLETKDARGRFLQTVLKVAALAVIGGNAEADPHSARCGRIARVP